MTDFRLFETMRVSEAGDVYLLERHLERLRISARYFSFKYDSSKLRDAVLGSIPQTGPNRIRLTLSREGAAHVDFAPLPTTSPERLRLSGVRVNSSDPLLLHKTTNRRIYEEARSALDENTDVILINERGQITETTIANIAVLRAGVWITPPVSCGLLPGVMRAELLSRGEIVEDVVAADQLWPGEAIRCFNALRGSWFGTVEAPT